MGNDALATEIESGCVSGSLLVLDSKIQIFLWCGIVIYILGILAIGCFAGRKVRNMDDFLVAGRRLPLWMASATLLATWFGAGSSGSRCYSLLWLPQGCYR